MSQHDMIISDADGATVLADITSALQAAASTSKGNSRPSTPYAGQLWLDDNTPSASVWTLYMYDGTDDIKIGEIDTTNNVFTPYSAALSDSVPVAVGSSDASKKVRIESDGLTTATTRVITMPDMDLVLGLHHGRCRLAKDGSNIRLSPYNGNTLVINGLPWKIPSGGVALAASGLTPGTTYYIYAYINSGTMTLEASATGSATDSTTGVEIKSGDATRTLVGMARPITGPAWQDSASQRFVISYFNRRGIATSASFTTTRNTTSAPYVEVNSEIRNEFLTWADTTVEMVAGGSAGISTAQIGYCGIGFDGTTLSGTFSADQAFTNSATVSCKAAAIAALTEGYHYSTFLGGVSGGATISYAADCKLIGKIEG